MPVVTVEKTTSAFHAAKGRRHVETLVPAIEFMCRQATIDLSEISAIAVDVGPGLFSGLRVGVAAAKALSQALRIPTIGISSLDLLAFPPFYPRHQPSMEPFKEVHNGKTTYRNEYTRPPNSSAPQLCTRST